jgi:hypothetical protein
VSFNGAGTCLIDANQAAGGSYSAAPQVQQSFKIVAAADPPQAITFTSTPPTNATVGGTYSVSATGGTSGNPVTFSVDASSTSASCTLSGSTVSFASAGSCVIDANQLGNASYSAAPQVQQPLTISKAAPSSPPPPSGASTLSVRVVGNHLVNGQGQTIRLLGVDRPGMDVLTLPGQCVTDDAVPIAPMLAWDINAVRIPLNEDCWLGINGVAASMMSAYRASLQTYVSNLNAAGLYVILDLHVSAPGTIPATVQQAMPDADHSPAFWSSVASTFVSDPAVVFDLFNEPFPDYVLPQGSDNWGCWLSGCTIPVVYTESGSQQESWQAAGMQQLVNAVRGTGATQPILLAGVNWANWMVGWLTHVPVDPLNQLAASIHVYSSGACNTPSCWTENYASVASQYPVITTEMGENDCSDSFLNQYMQFADANGISYLGWSWSIEISCSSQGGAALITDWTGTPSPEGAGLESHLQALAG